MPLLTLSFSTNFAHTIGESGDSQHAARRFRSDWDSAATMDAHVCSGMFGELAQEDIRITKARVADAPRDYCFTVAIGEGSYAGK